MDNEKINDVSENTEADTVPEEPTVENVEETAENAEVISETANSEEETDNTESEAEAEAEETDDEQGEETKAEAEEPTDENAEEAAENAEVISEEGTDNIESEAEAEAEEISDEDLCILCGENEKQEESEYCAECEKAMFSRKIPFLGHLAGIAVILFSFFAIILVLLISTPVLQVQRADSLAANKCWYTAYLEYAEVSSVIDSVNSMFGTTPFLQSGMGLSLKMIEAVGEYSGPFEAISVSQSLIGEDAVDEMLALRKYKKIRDEYISTYEAVTDAINEMYDGSVEKEDTYEKLSAVLGTENINDIYVYCFLSDAAAYYGDSEDVQLEYLEKADALKGSEKYAWFYYQYYADLLYKTGNTEKALKYLDAITDSDKSKFGAYELKMDIALAENNMDEANRILAEFKSNNDGYENAYILEATLLRCQKEYDKAEILLNEAVEQFDSVPEIHRQLALVYLLKENYDEAYEQAYTANGYAYYLYYYMGDSSYYTEELDNTLYLCAYLCKEKGEKTSDNANYIDEILNHYDNVELSEQIKSIINEEKTVAQVLTEGACDLA